MYLADFISSSVSKKTGNVPKEPGDIKRYFVWCPLTPKYGCGFLFLKKCFEGHWIFFFILRFGGGGWWTESMGRLGQLNFKKFNCIFALSFS